MATIIVPSQRLSRPFSSTTSPSGRVVLHKVTVTNPACDIYQIHLELKAASPVGSSIDQLVFVTRHGWRKKQEDRSVVTVGTPVFENRIIPVRHILRGSIKQIDIATNECFLGTICKKWWRARDPWAFEPA